MKAKWLVIGITAVLTVGLSTAVWAQWCGEAPLKLGQGCDAQQGTGQGWMAQLTEEQREQIRTEVGEMRERGVSPQEIRDAVREILEGWGVEPAWQGLGGRMRGYGPMMGGRGGARRGYGPMMGGRGMRGHGPQIWAGRAGPGWMSQLTQEQRQEIRATIRDMLEDRGIEPPQQGRGYGPMRGGRGAGPGV